jgi:hypothetical protein
VCRDNTESLHPSYFASGPLDCQIQSPTGEGEARWVQLFTLKRRKHATGNIVFCIFKQHQLGSISHRRSRKGTWPKGDSSLLRRTFDFAAHTKRLGNHPRPAIRNNKNQKQRCRQHTHLPFHSWHPFNQEAGVEAVADYVVDVRN